MRYLKIFEDFNNGNILLDVKDILLELEDIGFVTKIKNQDYKGSPNKIVITISKEKDIIEDEGDEIEPPLIVTEQSDFNLSEIEDVVLRLRDFLESSGFNLFYSDYYTYRENYNRNGYVTIKKDNFIIPDVTASEFRISFVKDVGILLKQAKGKNLQQSK